MNKRSYLIDTAETPTDKKRLKSDLKKLDAKFNPNKVASTSKTKLKDTGMQAKKKPVPASMLKKVTEKARNAKVKITGSASTTPRVSGSMIKSQPKTTTAKKTTKSKLTGPAAVRELQRQVSPAGVKKAEMDAKKAIAKKYPGLTKKSK
jgi:hypothetical protein